MCSKSDHLTQEGYKSNMVYVFQTLVPVHIERPTYTTKRNIDAVIMHAKMTDFC